MQVLNLPTVTVMNVNPGSIYNKKEEFHKFVYEKDIYFIFISGSWERPENHLTEIINLPDHTVISNPNERAWGWWQANPDHQQQQVSCQELNRIIYRHSRGGCNFGSYFAQIYYK